MSEGFKPIRITLSEEAFDRLEKIIKDASFRSYSSAIEECIRVVYDIILDVSEIAGKKGEPEKEFTPMQAFYKLVTIGTRIERFTGRQFEIQIPEQ